jgi:hypothetical protein
MSMANLCQYCFDQEIHPKDLYCPNCGQRTLPGDVRFETWRPGDDGPVIEALGFRLWPQHPAPSGLDLVVRCNGESPEIERVAIEAFNPRQLGLEAVALPGLAAALAYGRPVLAEVASELPAAPNSRASILRKAWHQPFADLKVVGALSMGALAPEGASRTACVVVRNDGGAVEIGPLSVYLPALKTPPPAAAEQDRFPPRLLAKGECASFEIRLPQTICEALDRSIAKAKGARLRGNAGEIDLPLVIVKAGPPSLTLHVRNVGRANAPSAGRAISGRRARLGLALANESAEPVRVESVKLRLGEGEWTAVEPSMRWRGGIEPGQIVAGELRPWMRERFHPEGAPLPERNHRFEVQVEARTVDSRSPVRVERRFVMKVVELAPLQGRVAIDFGTTETAAAASTAELQDGVPPEQPPFVVELGSVGLSAPQLRELLPEDGEHDISDPLFGQRFIETTLGLDRSGHWSIGDEIPPAEAAGPDRLLRFRRFKWLAAGREPARPLNDVAAILAAWDRGDDDIQERVDPKLLLKVFLTKVRELIEEHPDVGASCITEPKGKGSAKVFATRPVNMTPRMERAFIDGFAAAQMPQGRVKGFGGEGAMIFESWPPVLTVTEHDDPVFRRLTVNDAEISRTPLDEAKESARLLVFDVGGGSADFSAIGVTVSAKGTAQERTYVAVLKDRMSRSFVGTSFEQSIGKVLRRWFDKDDAWPENGSLKEQREFAETILWLQHSHGPLLSLGGAALLFGEEEPDADELKEQIRALLREGERLRIAEQRFARRPPSDHLPIDFADFPDLAAELVRQFRADYWAHMCELMAELKAEAPIGDNLPPVWLTISGRGAACPLADAMIRALIQDYIVEADVLPTFMPPPESKSITSWGALRLADQLQTRSRLRFVMRDEMTGFRILLSHGGHRMHSRPMEAHKAWVLRENGSARVIPAEEVEHDQFGDFVRPDGLRRPVRQETVALIRGDASDPDLGPNVPVYWSPPDAEPVLGREARQGVARLLPHQPEDDETWIADPPLERQWIHVSRRDGEMRVGVVVADDAAAAVRSILEQDQ